MKPIPAILRRIKSRITPPSEGVLWIRRENAFEAVCTVEEMKAVIEWAESNSASVETPPDGPPKLGEWFENTGASTDNPIRFGRFVEVVVRKGRLNPGTWYRLTDNGKFWMTKPEMLRRVDEPVKAGKPKKGRK